MKCHDKTMERSPAGTVRFFCRIITQISIDDIRGAGASSPSLPMTEKRIFLNTDRHES
jgi:hypothetical protein